MTLLLHFSKKWKEEKEISITFLLNRETNLLPNLKYNTHQKGSLLEQDKNTSI
jgi:hypothetical protein